jgi:hypothetical protein
MFWKYEKDLRSYPRRGQRPSPSRGIEVGEGEVTGTGVEVCEMAGVTATGEVVAGVETVVSMPVGVGVAVSIGSAARVGYGLSGALSRITAIKRMRDSVSIRGLYANIWSPVCNQERSPD